MGATKFEIHSEEINKTAEILKALGHPARLRMMLIIANNTDNYAKTSDISSEIQLNQSSISAHLKQLKDSGLINTRVSTNNKRVEQIYRINMPAIDELFSIIELIKRKTNILQDDAYLKLSDFYTKLKIAHDWNNSIKN